MQETKTFHALIFHKTWKYRVGLILGTYFKKSAASLFMSYDTLSSCKTQNPNSISEKKNSDQPDKRVNLRTVIHKTFTLTLWV